MGLVPPIGVTIDLLSIATLMFVTASILYFVRLVKGPTLPDMVLAIDVLSYDLAVFIILFSVMCESPLLAVGALPLMLWAYLTDMYVSKYLTKRELGD
jgi:multicomponent Na+:H+ antiporter subunit F